MTVFEIVTRYNIVSWMQLLTYDACYSSRSVKTVRTNIFAKNCIVPSIAITNTIFVKSITSDMHHRITYMYIHFQQNRVCRAFKPCTQIYLHNIASFIDLQLPIVICGITQEISV